MNGTFSSGHIDNSSYSSFIARIFYLMCNVALKRNDHISISDFKCTED